MVLIIAHVFLVHPSLGRLPLYFHSIFLACEIVIPSITGVVFVFPSLKVIINVLCHISLRCLVVILMLPWLHHAVLFVGIKCDLIIYDLILWFPVFCFLGSSCLVFGFFASLDFLEVSNFQLVSHRDLLLLLLLRLMC